MPTTFPDGRSLSAHATLGPPRWLLTHLGPLALVTSCLPLALLPTSVEEAGPALAGTTTLATPLRPTSRLWDKYCSGQKKLPH
eukprot:4423394-Amphidinium_carterae.1